MARRRRAELTVREFVRMTEPLSGVCRVRAGSVRRTGGRGRATLVNDPMPATRPGPDDGSGAHTKRNAASDATTVCRKSDAGSARASLAHRPGPPRSTSRRRPGGGDLPPGDLPRSLAEREKLGPGPELPQNGMDLLAAINQKVDVTEVGGIILRTADEKVALRLLEQLFELAYVRSPRTAAKTRLMSDMYDESQFAVAIRAREYEEAQRRARESGGRDEQS